MRPRSSHSPPPTVLHRELSDAKKHKANMKIKARSCCSHWDPNRPGSRSLAVASPQPLPTSAMSSANAKSGCASAPRTRADAHKRLAKLRRTEQLDGDDSGRA